MTLRSKGVVSTKAPTCPTCSIHRSFYSIRHSTNFVSFVSSEGRSLLRPVQLSSMHLSQVGWTTLTACFAGLSENLINKLQSVHRSAARLVLRKRKSIPLRMNCVISCTGFQSVKESSTNLVYLSTVQVSTCCSFIPC